MVLKVGFTSPTRVNNAIKITVIRNFFPYKEIKRIAIRTGKISKVLFNAIAASPNKTDIIIALKL